MRVYIRGSLLLAAVSITAMLVVVGCGDDDEEENGGDGGAANEVNVTLQEFNVIPDADSAAAGEITFNVENVGPDDVHELVIVKTDLEPDALPTLEDGSMDETGEGVEVIDEIEDIPVGETQTLTADLEAGSYVLVCNIYDEDEMEAHYEEGMRTGFTVE